MDYTLFLKLLSVFDNSTFEEFRDYCIDNLMLNKEDIEIEDKGYLLYMLSPL